MRGRFCDGTRHGFCGGMRGLAGGFHPCRRGIGPKAEGKEEQIAWLRERKRIIEEQLRRLEASSSEEDVERER